MKLQYLALTTTAFVAQTFALGINCRGSFQCVFLTDGPLDEVAGYIESIGPNREYTNGELIACTGFICAFLQSTPGPVLGSQILDLMRNLSPKCNQCGSIPTGFLQGDNDVTNGMLTINAVGGQPRCKTREADGSITLNNGLCTLGL